MDFRTETRRAAACRGRRQSYGSGKKSVLQQYTPHELITRKRVCSHIEEDYMVIHRPTIDRNHVLVVAPNEMLI